MPVFQSPPLYFFFFFFLSKISLLLIARSLNYDVTVTSKVRLRVTLTLRPTAEQRSYDILFPIPVFSATIFVCYCVVVAAAAVAVVAMLVLYVRLLSVFTTWYCNSLFSFFRYVCLSFNFCISNVWLWLYKSSSAQVCPLHLKPCWT